MGSLPLSNAKHPLDSLSGDEVMLASRIVRQSMPNAKLAFKAALLLEPAKVEMQPYLKAELANEPLPPKPERVAEVIVVHLQEPLGIEELHVNLERGQVVHSHRPDADQHAMMDVEEMHLFEQALHKDELFIRELSKVRLPEGAIVVADPWIYGSDSFKPQRRQIHFLCYMRNPKNNDPNSNHYAWPLPIVPVMDAATYKVTRVDWAYTGDESDAGNLTYDRENTMGHHTGNEYVPELRDEPARPIKPLHVSQPEGPSFTVDGQLIEWQDWRFRYGFNFREGLTLHDVSFKGRQLFYRLSFSDMTVPYGDPRAPLHRKQAFDLGDVGAGVTANSLKLGCDCLGVIKYFDGFSINRAGDPVHQENVICMHEQDDGLMWKHTHFRTGHAVAARSRILILQTILTVANYEYILNWKFDQAGGCHLELRATGILSTQHIDANKTSPYGTIVSPGVLAAHHQHIFSIRVDPNLDGGPNSVAYDETHPLPFETDDDKQINPYGVGFTNKRTFIEKEGFADLDPFKNRTFKIVNEDKINPVSKTPVAYKIHCPATMPILAHPDSVAHKRADFADHHFYVVKHRENQTFSAGRYTNQSYGTQNGLKDWIKGEENVRKADQVLYVNYGLTHSTRTEDFPVMPSEAMMLSFKPFNFFEKNPSNDLPASSQQDNQSVLAEDAAPSCCK